MHEPKRVFITDCEGPISKNDNAFELTSWYIPHGDKLFSVLSKYDDVQADVVKRPEYNAGNTLKLILPFFKAHGVTDKKMKDFSSEKILLVPEAASTLGLISSFGPAYIVSTSYQHYINALCESIGFPFENTYSTRVRIDDYEIDLHEETRIQKFAEEIARMPVMNIPASNSLNDFSEEDKGNITRLDEIIWEEISQMKIGRILKEIKPVGGREKANAVMDVVRKLDTKLPEVMYVGDSITDEEAFRLVREGGGLTVSFNGNSYAVKTAEIGVMSPNTRITANIACRFLLSGKDNAIEYVKKQPRVEVMTEENREEFSKASSKFRKNIRGEAIGKLG